MPLIQSALENAKRRAAQAAAASSTIATDAPIPPSDSADRTGGAVNTSSRSWRNLLDRLIPTNLEKAILGRNKILPGVEDRSAITAYKMLRTRVLQRMKSNHWQTLIVTGAGPGEGKTLTACNLALGIASDVNQSVVLIDLDLQHPTVGKYLGLRVEAGIDDYLAGKAKIEDIVYAAGGIERLFIIPNRQPLENSSELLGSPAMRDLLEWVKSLGPSTIAVLDMPPVLACDDVLALAPYVDALLLVASERHTERDSLARMMEVLSGRNIAGIVLNRVQTTNAISGDYY